jgi:hypothetical protein
VQCVWLPETGVPFFRPQLLDPEKVKCVQSASASQAEQHSAASATLTFLKLSPLKQIPSWRSVEH